MKDRIGCIERCNRPGFLVFVKMFELNDGGQNAFFSLRSWKNRGKSSKTAERRLVSHLKGRHWAGIWEGKAQRYPDGDAVFLGPASWAELEGRIV